jgi:hypothetical protein
MEANSMRRTAAALLVGGASLVLGGVAASSVAAQGGGQNGGNQGVAPPNGQQGHGNPQNDTRRQDFLNSLASKLNVSVDTLRAAMDQTRQELGGGNHQNGPRSSGPNGAGLNGGQNGDPQGRQNGGGPGMAMDAVAKALNITEQQLRQELPGKTLTDLANAHGVTPSTLASTLKTESSTRIDQAVTAGRLTADQAAQMKQGLSDRIDRMMTQAFPAQGQNQRGGPRGGDRGQGTGAQVGLGPRQGNDGQQGRVPGGPQSGASNAPTNAPLSQASGAMRL